MTAVYNTAYTEAHRNSHNSQASLAGLSLVYPNCIGIAQLSVLVLKIYL